MLFHKWIAVEKMNHYDEPHRYRLLGEDVKRFQPLFKEFDLGDFLNAEQLTTIAEFLWHLDVTKVEVTSLVSRIHLRELPLKERWRL